MTPAVMKKIRHYSEYLLWAVSVGVLLVLCIDKFQYGLIRYFDVDELAYLHWSHNVFAGRLPYRDFLSYLSPGYFYVLAPLYFFVQGTGILTAGRVVAFVIFMLLVCVSMLVFWRVRKSWMAILAGIILIMLPIPSDKFLEIRPDTLLMVCAFAGMWFLIRALEQSKISLSRTYFYWSGLWYSVALFILVKAVPMATVAILVIVCWWGSGGKVLMKERFITCVYFAAGLCTPLLLFVIWLAVNMPGVMQLNTVFYSLTKLPLEVNRIGELYAIQPYQFFYPNPIFYGADGYTTGFIVNHVLWFIGLCMGCVRLVTPFIPRGKKGAWAEVLIGGSFLVCIVTFIYGYPMRNAQYLIPIAVFVALYVADFWFVVAESVNRVPMGKIAYNLVTVVLLLCIVVVNNQVLQPKFRLTNASDYMVLSRALTHIPKDTYVFDLVGATVYFRDPYYVSAVPFGQWMPYMSRTLPSVSDALIRTGTAYVYNDPLNRILTLPSKDAEYIHAAYQSSPDDPSVYMKK
jgi:hypothetical protein